MSYRLAAVLGVLTLHLPRRLRLPVALGGVAYLGLLVVVTPSGTSLGT